MPIRTPNISKDPDAYKLHPDAPTIKLLRGLGEIMCTMPEVAAALGCTDQCLRDFFKRCPEAERTYKEAKERGKASLRRTQFRLAQRNAGMAIFLGKNYLGQSDRSEFTHLGPEGGPMENKIQIEFVRRELPAPADVGPLIEGEVDAGDTDS